MDGVWTSPAGPALRGIALDISGVRSTGAPERRAEPPVPGAALVISLEHAWRIAPAGDAPLTALRSFAGGIGLAPAVSEHDGRTHTIQVNLTPLGAAAVLGVPGGALANAVVAVGDLVGEREAELLAERLACLDGWRARAAALEGWLARRAAGASAPPPDVVRALALLHGSGGRVAVAEIERELRCSRRHLSRRFAEHVGCPPKAYARLVRFSGALEDLRHGTEPLARVAAARGYADQAHLAREVRALAGLTPTEVRADAQVTFVQDAPVVAA